MGDVHNPEDCSKCRSLDEILKNKGKITLEQIKSLRANERVGWNGDDKGRDIIANNDSKEYILNPLTICPHYLRKRTIIFEREEDGFYKVV